jgi:YVTN family beta-propeller protein
MYFRVIFSVLSVLLYAGILHAAPFAYIANNAGNTVSVLDTATNKVTKIIPVGQGPYGVAVNRMGSRVYVSNELDKSISVIDTQDNSVTTIPLAITPGALAVNSAGTRLFVANPKQIADEPTANSISIINTVSKTLVTTLSMPVHTYNCQPQGVAVSSADVSGNYRAYVACYGTDRVAVVTANDSGSYALSATEVLVPPGPRGISVSSDNKKIYVASTKASQLTVVDALTLATPPAKDTISVGTFPWGVAIDPSSTDSAVSAKLYVANWADYTVSVVDTIAGVDNTIKVASTIPVGDAPKGVAFTADGAKAITTNSASNPGTVSVILKSNSNVATIDGDSGPLTDPQNMKIGSVPNSFGNFAGPDLVTITTGVDDYNCGTVDTAELITPDVGVYKVAKGKDVKFNITALANCAINSVSIDSGASIGTPTTYTFTAPAKDYNIYATFTRLAWKISVVMYGTGTGKLVSQVYSNPLSKYVTGGGIDCGTSCVATNPTNTDIKLVPTPDAGSVFDGFTDACFRDGNDCTFTLNKTSAMLRGGDNGTFVVGVRFKNAGTSIRTNRGGTSKYHALLQDAYDAISLGTTVNPIDIDTSVESAILFDKNIAVTLVGGWSSVYGTGTLPAASASILNNGAAGVVIQYGSVTIGSYNNLGAIIIK